MTVPDHFSFPSGHSCREGRGALLGDSRARAGRSRVVFSHPDWFVPRVLSVHYPGDVVVGQSIALITAYLMHIVW